MRSGPAAPGLPCFAKLGGIRPGWLVSGGSYRHRCPDDDAKLLHGPVVIEPGLHLIARLVVALVVVLLLLLFTPPRRAAYEVGAGLQAGTGHSVPRQREVVGAEMGTTEERVMVGRHPQ